MISVCNTGVGDHFWPLLWPPIMSIRPVGSTTTFTLVRPKFMWANISPSRPGDASTEFDDLGGAVIARGDCRCRKILGQRNHPGKICFVAGSRIATPGDLLERS